MPSLNHAENGIRRSLKDFPFRKRVAMMLGVFLLALFPLRAQNIQHRPFTCRQTLLNRFLRNGILHQAFTEENHEDLRKFLADYWKEYSATFHEDWQDRFERLFLSHDQIVFEDLEELLQSKGTDFTALNLYEIGCGGGDVTQHLRRRFPDLEKVVGIDLGAEQIEQNQKKFQAPGLMFRAADAVEWIPENADPHSIFVTNGGVLEYFLEDELDHLFQHISRNLRPAAVVIIETIGSDYDLEKEKKTLVYGRELAFSHNYPHLLRKNGFELHHQSERIGEEIDGGGRWIRLLAVAV